MGTGLFWRRCSQCSSYKILYMVKATKYREIINRFLVGMGVCMRYIWFLRIAFSFSLKLLLRRNFIPTWIQIKNTLKIFVLNHQSKGDWFKVKFDSVMMERDKRFIYLFIVTRMCIFNIHRWTRSKIASLSSKLLLLTKNSLV